MKNLESQALRLLLRLDSEIERYDESDIRETEYSQRIRKLIPRASVRYYRRRDIKNVSPFSLVNMIVDKAQRKQEQEEKEKTLQEELKKALEEMRATYSPSIVDWPTPPINPKISHPGWI